MNYKNGFLNFTKNIINPISTQLPLKRNLNRL